MAEKEIASRKRLPYVVVVVVIFIVWLGSEWRREVVSSNASILFGPLHLASDVAPANIVAGIIIAIVLFPCLFAFALRSSVLTACCSIVGWAVWLFLGLIGQGIDA